MFLTLGRPGCGTVTPDLSFGDDDWQLYVRALIVGEIGDSPNINIRRAYPDSGPYNQPPAQVPDGVPVGYVTWQAYTGDRWSGRMAQVYARTVGAATDTNSAGALYLATTSPGQVDTTDRVKIGADGTTTVYGNLRLRNIGADTPTGGGDGDVCKGDGCLWVNDHGTWKRSLLV